MIRRRRSTTGRTAKLAAKATAENVASGQEPRPQRLKPHSKQCSYRSAEALRHPKSSATPSYPTACKAARTVALLCAAVAALLACPATAADLAILRNGFSIRHEHRLVMGAMTRLFFGADDSSFTDVPTAEITGYEKDLSSSTSMPLAAPAGQPGAAVSTSMPSHSVPALSAPCDRSRQRRVVLRGRHSITASSRDGRRLGDPPQRL